MELGIVDVIVIQGEGELTWMADTEIGSITCATAFYNGTRWCALQRLVVTVFDAEPHITLLSLRIIDVKFQLEGGDVVNLDVIEMPHAVAVFLEMPNRLTPVVRWTI